MNMYNVCFSGFLNHNKCEIQVQCIFLYGAGFLLKICVLRVMLCGSVSVSVSVSAILCPALGLRSASKLHCIALIAC
jgi:hypothetical protein